MKKKAVICMAVIAAIIAVGSTVFMLYRSNQPYEVKTFALSSYQQEIEAFPSDKNVGQIDDADTAVEKAKELWIDAFSAVGEKPYQPAAREKIEVSYDANEECWHVNDIAPTNAFGGVSHAIIQKSGEVVAVWRDD